MGKLSDLAGFAVGATASQPTTELQIANPIVQAENGVDELRDDLNKRGENASSAAVAAPRQSSELLCQGGVLRGKRIVRPEQVRKPSPAAESVSGRATQ